MLKYDHLLLFGWQGADDDEGGRGKDDGESSKAEQNGDN